MEANTENAEIHAQGPKLAFTRGPSGVNSSVAKTYGDERRKLFQPSRQQTRDARRWLVRIIARRAVEILNAQETLP